jgi:purine-nucleoside phosphorylase
MPFAAFLSAAGSLAPKAAVVLGSGLGRVVERLAVTAEIGFADLPGFAAPTVRGHSGRALAGAFDGVPVLVFQGRTHSYEGHPRDRVTAAVRLAADLGVKRLILTNAAGGIRADLNPGDLMAIRGHIKLLDRDAWRAAALRTASRLNVGPYSPRLIDRLTELGLPAGTYAALTGPCYETPAEIRALAAMGADAVGMSTAMEAEAARDLGLEVAAVSCITNKAAGLAAGPLDHKEVLQTAAAPADRLANLIGRLVVE